MSNQFKESDLKNIILIHPDEALTFDGPETYFKIVWDNSQGWKQGASSIYFFDATDKHPRAVKIVYENKQAMRDHANFLLRIANE